MRQPAIDHPTPAIPPTYPERSQDRATKNLVLKTLATTTCYVQFPLRIHAMRIRKHGNPAITGAGIVARMWDKFYYLSRNKAGYYWAGPFATPLMAFRLARLETLDRS